MTTKRFTLATARLPLSDGQTVVEIEEENL